MKAFILKNPVAVVLVALLLVACGGGSDDLAKAESPQASYRIPLASQVDASPTNAAVFDWIEYKYPELFYPAKTFPDYWIDYSGIAVRVRSYSNGNNLAVTSTGDVYGVGPFTGGVLTSFGPVSAFASLVVSDKCAVYPDQCGPGGISPIPIGTGLLVGYIGDSFFYRVNEGTGAITRLPDTCSYIAGADVGPDGIVYVNSFRTVNQADPINGGCRQLFEVPELMWALAVSPAGEIVTISDSMTAGRYQVYRYTKGGTLLSKSALSASLGLREAGRMDFAPNGDLIIAGRRLDPVTGVLSDGFYPPHPELVNARDIAIDSNGLAHTVSWGTATVYDVSSGKLVKTIVLDKWLDGNGAAIFR